MYKDKKKIKIQLMGNRLHEIDQKIQKDVKSRIDDKYAHQYSSQSSDQSQSDNSSQNRKLNWWQKLIYRDQSNSQYQSQSNPNAIQSVHPTVIQIPNQQRTILHPQSQYQNRIHTEGRKGGSKENIWTIKDGKHSEIRQNAANLLTEKLLFTEAMQKQSQKIKLNWKPLKQEQHINTNSNYINSLLNKLFQNQLLHNRHIFYAQYKQQIASSQQQATFIVAQKIQINDSELINHLTRHQILSRGNSDQTLDSLIQDKQRLSQLIYKWRVFVSRMSLSYQDQPFPIVALYHVTASRLNLSFQPRTSIYQQLILCRISEVRHLTHLQGLYALEQALIGFKMLYDVFGHFVVDESMIGFNFQGQLKVWISPYFWSNLCHSVVKMHPQNYSFNGIMSIDGKNQYEQEEMVSRIWMIVQKYSLFQQSIVMECGGFRKCNFSQALSFIVRYKCSIIDRRNEQLGMIKFVNRLQFQSQIKQNSLAPVKTVEVNKVKSIIGQLLPSTKHSQKIQIEDKKPYTMQSLNQNRWQKQLTKPIITRSMTGTNPESHIRILDSNRQGSKSGKILWGNKRRPPIFDTGYDHTMSNNIDQKTSIVHSNNQLNSQYRSSGSLFGDNPQPTQHVKFINIRSLK